METLEKGVKYVRSKLQEKHQNDANDVIVFLLLTVHMFRTFF